MLSLNNDKNAFLWVECQYIFKVLFQWIFLIYQLYELVLSIFFNFISLLCWKCILFGFMKNLTRKCLILKFISFFFLKNVLCHMYMGELIFISFCVMYLFSTIHKIHILIIYSKYQQFICYIMKYFSFK